LFSALIFALPSCSSIWLPEWLDFILLGRVPCSSRANHNRHEVRKYNLEVEFIYVSNCHVLRYLIEQPPSKKTGIGWFHDVFCPPLPPKPDAVAPATTDAAIKLPWFSVCWLLWVFLAELLLIEMTDCVLILN
jgi:hypothetical protein